MEEIVETVTKLFVNNSHNIRLFSVPLKLSKCIESSIYWYYEWMIQ